MNSDMQKIIAESAKPILLNDVEPTPLTPPEKELPPYPVDALGPLSSGVKAIAEEVQAPIPIVANSVLAAAALSTQHLANVILDNRKIPLNLFFLTLAVSGDRKSTVDRMAIGAIREKQHKLEKEYNMAQKNYRAQLDSYNEIKKSTLSNHSKRTTSPDKLTEELEALIQPTSPPKPRILISDITYEGMVKNFFNGQPSQGMFNDEGGLFFGGHAMKDDTLMRTISGFSKFWDGDDISRTRAAEGESMTIRTPRLSSHIMIQPIIAAKILNNPLLLEQGFLARFQIVSPDTLQGNRQYKEQKYNNLQLIEAYNSLLLHAINQPYPLDDDGNLNPRSLPVSAEAKTLWVKAYNLIETNMRTGKLLEHIRPFASKSAEQICRIAGVLTLITDPNAKEISSNTMKQAIDLCDWYLCEALRLLSHNQETSKYELAEKALDWLANLKKETFSKRDIQQFGPSEVRNNIETTLSILIEYNWIYPIEEQSQNTGKRIKRYRVNQNAQFNQSH